MARATKSKRPRPMSDADKLADRDRRGVGSSTPERLARSGIGLVLTENGRQEFCDWPVKMLFDMGLLGATDQGAPGWKRKDAGERYYTHWHRSRMSPLGARDYRQPFAGVTGAFPVMPATEQQAYHRRAFREAFKALGMDRIGRATSMIVLEEIAPAEVGLCLTDRNNEGQARAVAIEMLIDGLDRLIAHWGERK